MTKKNLFDTSKLQEVKWGNIELPGMTDEELHSTNWNWIDAMKARDNNPNYKQAHTDAIKQRNKTDNWKQSRSQFNQTKSKRIMTPDGIFNSRAEAAAHYNISPPGIKRRIDYHPEQYYYID
jgi:hypothetical protein